MVLSYNTQLNLYIRICVAVNNLDYACTVDSYYNPTLGACAMCNTLFPNCAACNNSTCIMCVENFYFATMINAAGAPMQMCASQCQLGYGPDQQNKTACRKCSLPNCRSCIFQVTGTQVCQFCNKGFYLNATTLMCVAQSPTKTLNYYVRSAPYTRGLVTPAMLAGNGNLNTPFLFLYQALVNADLVAVQYKNVITNIYMFPGTHFYFKCDSQTYTPTKEDKTINLFDYCGALGAQISNYYFQNDNNQVTIQASLCNQLGGNAKLNTNCVNLPAMPIIYINSPNYYFNITNYYKFINLQFSGSNAFAIIPTNTSIKLQYFPVGFCNINQTPFQKNGLFNFTSLEPSALTGFHYSCVDPYYQGSRIPNNSNLAYKCNYTNTNPQGVQSCGGEPMYQSFFQGYVAPNQTYLNGVYYEQKRKTLFNLYGFNDFFSSSNTPPTLILQNCQFSYFLYNYESLINVETYHMYINTQPTANTFVANNFVYYTYTGRDKGANIQISGSTFQYSRFCKGAILYRKPINIADFNWIFNLTLQFSQVKSPSFSGNYVNISSSTFTQMNYAANTTAITLFGANNIHPKVNLYSGVPNQPILQYSVIMHKGIVLNLEDFGGAVEVSGSTFTYNSIFIPEILMVNYSLSSTYSLAYFQNTITNEIEFSACNYDNGVNQYFLSTGFDKHTNIENMAEQFERLSPIYISRNHGVMIFKNNVFSNNIGMFGGAICINSPNMAWSGSAYVIISNCQFNNNMAYLTGGAVFVRSAILETDITTSVCAGTHVINSTFTRNMGLKKSNGGGLTVYCDLISKYDLNQQDIASTSRIIRSSQSQFFNSSEFLQTISIAGLMPGESYKVYRESTSVLNTVFTNNQAGLKGTAAYINYQSNVIINNSTFFQNSPTYAFYEVLYSPYYLMMSNQSLMFYDELHICSSSFQFLQNCSRNYIYIDWPQVQGALALEFCDQILCLNNSVSQGLLITNSVFNQNEAGPFLSTYQTLPMTSSLSISGGFNTNITNTQFINAGSFFGQYVQAISPFIVNFFPTNYYNYSQAPMIRIKIEPQTSVVPINYSVVFLNVTFQNNTHVQIQASSGIGTYQGSLITYSSNALQNTLLNPQFNFTSCTVRDNYFLGQQASLFYINNALVSITKNAIINNGYINQLTNSSNFLVIPAMVQNFEFSSYSFTYIQQYGVFWLDIDFIFNFGQYHYIYLNTFKFNFADQGSAFMMQLSYQSVQMLKNNYNYHFAYTGGTVLSVSSNQGQSTVQMQFETFSRHFGGTYGAIYSSNAQNTLNNQLILYISNSVFTNCNAEYGSAIAAELISKVFNQFNIFQRSAPSYSTSFVQRQFVQYIYPFSVFMGNTSIFNILVTQPQSFGHVYLLNMVNNQSIIFGSNVLQGINYPLLNYNEFNGCLFTGLNGSYGSAIYSSNSWINMVNSQNNQSQGIFNGNSVVGMVYLFDLSVFIASNVIFANNQAASDGSSLFSDQSSITLQSCLIQNNTAPIGQGGIFAQGNSVLQIDSTSFIGNFALDSSAIYSNMNQIAASSITNCLFENNTSMLTLIDLTYTNMTVSNSQFINNIAQSITHGFTLQSSVLIVINSIVTYTDPQFLWNNSYSVDYGFFNLLYKSTLNLTQGTNILYCRGKTAASIYISSQSNFYLENNVIIQNCQSLTGSNIYILLADQAFISDTLFSNNSMTDITFERVNLTITNSQFMNGGNQYLYGEFSNVTLNSVTMSNITNSNGNGGGLYCNCLYINVTNCQFSNLDAFYGGAMYLNLNIPNSYSSISSSTFTSNSAQFGGGIYIETINQLYINNNTFWGNYAEISSTVIYQSNALAQAMGGALYFDCLYQTGIHCQLILQNQNLFQNNFATHQGGAIMYVQNKYIQQGTASLFYNNSAFYGPDYASYPTALQYNFVSNNDVVTGQYSLRVLSSSLIGGWTIVSGVGFSIQVVIADADNQVYSIDNSSLCLFKVVGRQDVQLSNYQATADQGIYSFDDVTVLAVPGTNVTLEIEIYGLTTYGNPISFLNNPVQVQFYVRNCAIGETYTADYACLLCPATTYLLIAATNQTNCTVCQADAICFNGSNIAPKLGFWRSSNASENFINCPNYYACLAGNQTNPIGICAPGYQQALCGNCQNGYYKPNAFQCNQCASGSTTVAYIFIQIVIAFFYTLFLTKSIINGIEYVGPPIAIYFRVITSHYQILNIISMTDFGWSSAIQTLISGQAGLFDFTTRMFNIGCLLSNLQSNGSIKINPYYLRLLIIFFLPVLLFAIAAFSWGAVFFVTRKVDFIRQKIICTFLILFFLNYSAITKILLQGIACILIDTNHMLMIDVTIQCFTGSHLTYFIVIIFPGIVMWVIGVPFVVMVILIKKRVTIFRINNDILQTRDHLNQINYLKLAYGFYLQGYKYQSFYLWEIFIFFLKALIILFSLVLQAVSPETIAFITIFILVVQLAIIIKKQPYVCVELNNLEELSRITCIVTMYCGLFFISNYQLNYTNNPIVEWIFFIILLIVHLMFISYSIYLIRIETLKYVYLNYKSLYFFRVVSCGITKPNVFAEKYLQDPNSRHKNYKIEDEDLEEEIAKEGESPGREGQAEDEKKRIPDFNDKAIQQEVDDIISRLRKSKPVKVSQVDKSASVIHPKDIILDLNLNKSSDSPTVYSDDEERSFKKNEKKKKRKEAKVTPLESRNGQSETPPILSNNESEDQEEGADDEEDVSEHQIKERSFHRPAVKEDFRGDQFRSFGLRRNNNVMTDVNLNNLVSNKMIQEKNELEMSDLRSKNQQAQKPAGSNSSEQNLKKQLPRSPTKSNKKEDNDDFSNL